MDRSEAKARKKARKTTIIIISLAGFGLVSVGVAAVFVGLYANQRDTLTYRDAMTLATAACQANARQEGTDESSVRSVSIWRDIDDRNTVKVEWDCG